jgi:DnaJ-class molecular chaperone
MRLSRYPDYLTKRIDELLRKVDRLKDMRTAAKVAIDLKFSLVCPHCRGVGQFFDTDSTPSVCTMCKGAGRLMG